MAAEEDELMDMLRGLSADSDDIGGAWLVLR